MAGQWLSVIDGRAVTNCMRHAVMAPDALGGIRMHGASLGLLAPAASVFDLLGWSKETDLSVLCCGHTGCCPAQFCDQ